MEDILIDGAKIRRLRKNKGWSQFDLARVSWVDQGTISQLETNRKNNLRADTLVRLARALGVALDELFVPADPSVVEPTDPQLDVMMRLVTNMTPEERASAEMFIRFVLAQRRHGGLEIKRKPTAHKSPASSKRKE
jgi:transcriptional regulator with XRE-family HTH domain